MKITSRTLLFTAAVSAAVLSGGCKKTRALPNLTGTFETSDAMITFWNPGFQGRNAPSTVHSAFRVTLSDEQADSTAVRLWVKDGSIYDIACDGRAARTERDDGASFAVGSLECNFVDDAGVRRPHGAEHCRIQSGALGLRFDRAPGTVTVDVGALDVAFSYSAPEHYDDCHGWMRARAANGISLRRTSP